MGEPYTSWERNVDSCSGAQGGVDWIGLDSGGGLTLNWTRGGYSIARGYLNTLLSHLRNECSIFCLRSTNCTRSSDI